MVQNRETLKRISRARLNTVRILIKAEDWDAAAYMLGYVLECALKARICKILDLSNYQKQTDDLSIVFMTHNFDKLKILSGFTTIFSALGISEQYENWSEFTVNYPGEWPSMRYNPVVWDEIKVKSLYNNLTERSNGVLSVIKRKW